MNNLSTRAAPKVMPPILLYWPTISGVDVGGMTVEAEPDSIPLCFVAVWQMAAEGLSDKMASDMEVHMKKKCGTEFLHAEKISPIDTHWYLLNVYREQTVDRSTVRRWVVCYSSGNSNVKDKPRSGWPHTAVMPWNEEHLDQLTRMNWQTRELCTELNIGFKACNGSNLGISQSLLQVSPKNTHRRTERTLHASLSRPTEPIQSRRW